MHAKTRLSFEYFRSLRAKYAYAAYSTVPSALVFVAKLAQYTSVRCEDEKEEASRLIRNLSKVLHLTSSLSGLKYINIPPQNVEVVVCLDDETKV